MEPEGQEHGIIIGVTRLLLLGPFYSIQTNFLYIFAHDCIMVRAWQLTLCKDSKLEFRFGIVTCEPLNTFYIFFVLLHEKRLHKSFHLIVLQYQLEKPFIII